ncbi:MAG TPA: hypothetical protein PK760_12275, partial [Flavobacteriales bacterium]|nr:hypothetical protein [Flavobacteriales bacterium]
IILSGSTMLGERKAYKVTTMTTAGANVSDDYDAETNLKLRRVELKFMYGKSLTVITEYSDYQPSEGVLFPRTIVQHGGSAGSVEMKVVGIEANKPLAPTFFETGLPVVTEE